MPKNVHIEMSEEQYVKLSGFKDERGFTWQGLLLEGYRALDTEETTE